MILQSKVNADFTPHPEGIFPAVCVDVIDLGLMESEFQGRVRMVNKVRLVWETEQKDEEGKARTLSKTFTASLNAKAKLAEFLGKWRGRPVVPGETIDLSKVLGVCCTLVVSQQQSLEGRTYASIDAISKATKKVVASGRYDPALARQKVEEWKAKVAFGPGAPAAKPSSGLRPPSPNRGEGQASQASDPSWMQKQAAPGGAAPAATKSTATAAPVEPFDPEVGF